MSALHNITKVSPCNDSLWATLDPEKDIFFTSEEVAVLFFYKTPSVIVAAVTGGSFPPPTHPGKAGRGGNKSLWSYEVLAKERTRRKEINKVITEAQAALSKLRVGNYYV